MTETTNKAPTAAEKKAAAAAKKAAPLGYLQNKEGRVFIATPELMKQAKKGKFGLMKITASVYEEAIKNGGMTEAMPDFDEDED